MGKAEPTIHLRRRYLLKARGEMMDMTIDVRIQATYVENF